MSGEGGSSKDDELGINDLPDVLKVRLKAQEEELRRLTAKLEEQFQYRAQLNTSLARHRRELDAANATITQLRSSISFRLGALVVGVARSPRLIFSVPGELLKLFRELAPRAWRRLTRRWRDEGAALDLGPEFADVDLPAADDSEGAAPIVRLMHGTENAPALPTDISGMRIATIMDEFSFAAFRHCGDLRQVVAGAWQEQMETFAPHMLLVESAWKGKDESWARKIYPLSKDLVNLVAWCRARRIPTVFWNKEDPVHLSVFMRTARQFDFVFTTDIDCVRAYKAALGHEQVYWLPFACQPAEHNPVEQFNRQDRFCFAGSFYAKYPERQRDFAAIIQAVQEFRPVDIYDRNAGSDDPTLVFPDQYARMIQGSLPHDQISIAYKGYRFGININTVKQSQSMFARRAFDLLASNTVTVSNFSRGLRMLLGDLVLSSDDAGQLGDRLRPLVEDERRYRKFRLAGLRKVMSEHTYQDRLRYLVGKVAGREFPDDRVKILTMGGAKSAAEAEAIINAFRCQTWTRKELLLVVDGVDLPDAAFDGVTILRAEEARELILAEQGEDCWVALLDPRDHYGRSYLFDLAIATRYTTATTIGKSTHYSWAPEGVVLQKEGRTYGHANSIPWRRAIVQVSHAPVPDLLGAVRAGSDSPLPDAFAIDEFNYCANGCDQQVGETVDDLDDIWVGLPLERLQHLAEQATAADNLASRRQASPELDAHSLAEILPVGEHADGQVHLVEEVGGLRLNSKLGNDEHTYLYTRSPVPVDRLFDGAIGKFNFVVETEMLVSLVFVYLDDAGKRLGHAIRACSSNLNMAPPAGTARVRIGLRVQGPGTALIRKLVLGHIPSPVAGIPAAGRHLVISRGYPAYDNLYSYAYVHRRIIGYAESGLSVDVFRVTENDLSFSEFEGVDVVSGPLADLELMIRTNDYGTLVVHSLDRALWSVLSQRADGRPIVVWVHGAEIQPWYRRDFSFLDDRDRERGIQRSNDRMEFWRELFETVPSSVKFVFVSRRLAREAFRDVGVELDPSQYVVIHNHIDGELFEYQPKPVDQRHRILSIRPYSRPTYANDLSVRAILDLANEPFFPELEFRLVGDGRLFEETVEPVRQFRNVMLDQRFLSQREIASLHKSYGVFLVPTRIDSQGVSRDEAMASGLVPITNRVSAVPEFVDERSAFLAEPEDWKGLADAIRRLHAEPETFREMSAEAARRVRLQSGLEKTLGREVALLEAPWEAQAEGLAVKPPRPRIALYGDLDLNRIDGSAVWAASLAQVLAGDDAADVDLYLKAPIRQTQIIRPLLGLVNVRLIEPPQGAVRLSPAEALDSVVAADESRAYDAIVLRGLALARDAVERPALGRRLWVYLTDVPQRLEDLTDDARQTLSDVANGAAVLLCQTRQLAQHLERIAPSAAGKTRLLPPMVPDVAPIRMGACGGSGRTLRLAYAGKFAPLWGIRELLEAFDALRAEGAQVELHVFGDKVHNPPDDPGFRKEVTTRLQAGRGLTWYRGLDRANVLAHMATMDVGWAWRSPDLEGGTLELSTKLLEYALCGTPPILARGPVNVDLLGDDYPLFADRAGIIALLRKLASDPQQLHSVQAGLGRVAADYAFTTVRERYVAPLLSIQPSRDDRVSFDGGVSA